MGGNRLAGHSVQGLGHNPWNLGVGDPVVAGGWGTA